MPPPYEPVAVEPKQGGALITQESLENVGAANYSVKRDWRRYFDAEVRREGDTLFQPSSGSLNNQPYPSQTGPITLVHTCRRANGQIATVVGTQTTLYRYFTFNDGNVYDNSYQAGVYANESGDWYTIGQNFSTNGTRWEAVDVAGYTIFNNGVDLPIYYDISKRSVTPLHELREQGIASVGTISAFNGMLLCSDITNMTASYTATCLNGVGSGIITASQSGTAVTSSTGFFTSSMVGQTLTYATGRHCKILTYNSATSVTVDTAQNVSSAVFNVAILFGIANDPTQTSRIRYQIINSNVGDPTAFGSLSTGSATEGSEKITLSQPMYSLHQGDSVIVTSIGAAGSAITANVLAVDNINHKFIYIDQAAQESTQNVTFSITAVANSGSLRYQWNFNGQTISGATSSSYTISNVSTANAGNYNVTIYDASGSVNSNTVVLTVYAVSPPPIITTQPPNANIAYGKTATFTIATQSADPVSYQWAFNNAIIPGANAATYVIPAVTDLDAGLYTCALLNLEGTTVSNSVILTVPQPSTWTAPTIFEQPAAISVTAGQPATLQIGVTGIPDVTYQWEVNLSGWIPTGINSPQFSIACTTTTATYRCIVTNAKGTVTSSTAVITVNAPSSGPTITVQTSETPIVIFAPANVTVQKAAYPGSAISSQNLQDDGSAIIRAIDLRGTLVVLKETTIFIGTFTGTAGGPIAYQKIYTGPDCIYWKWMLSVIDGTYLVYATQKDFFTFDLTLLLPRKHPQLRNASSVFYNNGFLGSQQDQCFSVTNELTREVWFMFPGNLDGAICFDYEWNTCSTLGALSYTAACTVDLPTATTLNDPKKVFVMGDNAGVIRAYGLDTESGSTYLRSSNPYTSTISSGYVSFGDEYGEKDLRAYIAFCRQLAPFTVTLFSARNAHEPPVTLFTETIASPTYQTLIPTFYRANYFQDQIVVSGTNQNCSLVRRIFDASKIDSRSAIKHT